MNYFLNILDKFSYQFNHENISKVVNKLTTGIIILIIILVLFFLLIPTIILSIFANRSKEAKRLGFKTFIFFLWIIPLIVYVLRVKNNYSLLTNKQDYENRIHNIIVKEWKSYQPVLFWLIVNFLTGCGILVFLYHCNKLEKFINNFSNQQPNRQSPYNATPNNQGPYR